LLISNVDNPQDKHCFYQ